MPKKKSKKKSAKGKARKTAQKRRSNVTKVRPHEDVNEIAARIVRQAIERS